jgi:phage terminase large subunit
MYEDIVNEPIVLDAFKPRWYQEPIFDAIENKGYKRVIAVLPRRAGKDIACWNLIIRQALSRVGIYWYILPTYSQGKKVIFDGIDTDGKRFIDYIPRKLIKSSNSQEQKIMLVNGSLIQIVGASNIDRLVGSNPIGCIFSEYAMVNDPQVYQLIRPILSQNDGFCCFISTPRGHNSFYDLWNIAQQNRDIWFSYRLTVEDTKHIPLELIEIERQSGEMSEDLIQQEYYVSWDQGVQGAWYTRYLDNMRVADQIAKVPWEFGYKVNTAWDIGMRDQTSIIMYQTIGATLRIIDCYENSGVGLEHYVAHLKSKPYQYGVHIAPHDIKVREWGTGLSRLEKAEQLGISFDLAPDLSVADGIEAVRTTLSKIWIDEKKCQPVIKMLENYRKEWDSKRQVYRNVPLHDKYSHMADALRYLCVSLEKTRDGLTADDVRKMHINAMYGDAQFLPAPFR